MKCLHCTLETNSNTAKFCCNGCEAAYNLIHEVGLNSYYQKRLINNDVRKLKAEVVANLPNFNKYISDNGAKEKSINLIVEGIHCAACIWLIETMLLNQEFVTYARINMSTKRLKISWQGDVDIVNRLIKLIYTLGYKVIPYDPRILDKLDKKFEKTLLKNIAISGFAAGNVMLISVILWSSTSRDMGVATKQFLEYISVLIAAPAIIYSSQIFLKSAFNALKNKATNMDVPISLAIILASVMSLLSVITNGKTIYFESVLMLIFFLTIGRFLDQKARGKARGIVHDLLLLNTGFATVIKDGKYEIVAIDELKKTMLVLVSSGEKIAADGEVIQGESEVDMSIINGETLPQHIVKGDKVFAGTTNLGGSIIVKITSEIKDNLINQIAELLEKSEQTKTRYITMADRLARLYTPIVHLLALVTFVMWFFVFDTDWQNALLYAISVLIITCPCALALAVPVVQVLASSKLMKSGILIKSADALEKLADIDKVVFDKTGTLTKGNPELVNKFEIGEENMQLAVSMAAQSKHILARNLTPSYSGKVLNMTVREYSGQGLEAYYQNQIVKLGRASWCGILTSSKDNFMEMWLTINNKAMQRFVFKDIVRDDASAVIQRLKQLGLAPEIISGDKEVIVNMVAKQLGVENFRFGLLPHEKQDYILNLKQKGQKILMVGDGLNDALALSEAHVSMSPTSALDITQNVADIVFQGERLEPILTTLTVANLTKKLVKQNFALALLYNIVAVSFAVCGLVTPLIAAVAMSTSSLIVILNSLRIGRV